MNDTFTKYVLIGPLVLLAENHIVVAALILTKYLCPP